MNYVDMIGMITLWLSSEGMLRKRREGVDLRFQNIYLMSHRI